MTTLVGAVGTGKTQLVTEYAHRMATRFGSLRWIAVSGTTSDAKESCESAIQSIEHAAVRPPLVVIDGARSWVDAQRHMPSAPAHVLITSTAPAVEWTSWAEVVHVGPWERTESVDFLRENVPLLSTYDADRVSAVLGDLPLALVYAEFWLKRARTADDFLAMLRSQPARVFGGPGPDGYPSSLTGRMEEARDSSAVADQWLAHLLDAAALLGPAPLPIHAFSPGELFGPDNDTLSTELLLYGTQLIESFPSVGKSGLASLEHGVLRVAPVYCAAVRGLLPSEALAHAVRWAEVLLVALAPRHSGVDEWGVRDRWKQIVCQFIAYDPSDVGTREGLFALAAAYDHMLDMGRWREVLNKLESLRRRGHCLFPEDHPAAMRVGDVLLRAYSCAQSYRDAVELGAELLDRRASALGTRHRETLRCASALIVPLGASGGLLRAVERATETMAAQKDMLGDCHPETLLTISRRAALWLMTGHWQDSVTVGEKALAEQRRVLGDAHPHTLATAYHLARAYAESGIDAMKALDLFSITYEAQGRVLGDRHPATLRTAAGYVLQDCDVHNACSDAELYRWTLERLRQEFGVEDRDVYRIERLCRRLGLDITV
ncbi:hypothetical protein [Streptomyces cacaoi]|uniref:hypothetical protein n=1 Tax=Streptomyces cacaoi TaxID=1898 RepID=UPI00374A3AE0